MAGDGVRVFEPATSAQTQVIDAEDVVVDGVTRARQRIGVARSLTERMLSRAPVEGYSLWLDTADITYIYIAEAPTADAGTVTSFRGIRVQKDATGNPLGKVQIANDFAWDSRSSAVWS